jgi:hypothetical protein
VGGRRGEQRERGAAGPHGEGLARTHRVPRAQPLRRCPTHNNI